MKRICIRNETETKDLPAGRSFCFHEDCTHLDLTIIATTTDEVGSLRNEYGARYRKCDYFPSGYTGPVYVTAKGDRYYPSLNYGGVTRHDSGRLQLCLRSFDPVLPSQQPAL